MGISGSQFLYTDDGRTDDRIVVVAVRVTDEARSTNPPAEMVVGEPSSRRSRIVRDA